MYYSSSRYLVVKFLVLPYEKIDQYVCVPESWQRWRDPDGEVAIAYPEEKPEDTSIRALNYEECSKRWKIYMAKVCYKTDFYTDALDFIVSIEESKFIDMAYKLQNMNISSTSKSNSIENKTKKNTPNTPSTSTKKLVIKDTEENTPSNSRKKTNKKDKEKITPLTSTTITVKNETEEMIPSTPIQKFFKKETENKTPLMSTPKIDKKKIEKNKTSPSSANANKNPSEKTNNQNAGKEIRYKNVENKTKKNTPSTSTKKIVIKETDENTPSNSTPKTNKKDTEEMTPSTSTPITVKNETEEMTPSTSTQKVVKKETEDITPVKSTPKIDKKKAEKNKPSPSSANANKNPSEENNQNTRKEKKEVNKTPQNKIKSSPYKIPMDFNPKDLKDMFRHNSPNLGEVVELLPNTGVFIEFNVLETKFKNYSDMAEGLMKGIFTNKALRNCTMSGEPSIAKNHSDSDTRPALDQDAREAIIRYVYENCYKHWKEGRNSIEYAMRKVLVKSRSKQ